MEKFENFVKEFKESEFGKMLDDVFMQSALDCMKEFAEKIKREIANNKGVDDNQKITVEDCHNIIDGIIEKLLERSKK